MGLAHGAQEPLGVRDGLVLYLDAANARSYPRSGTTWFDRSGNGNNGTLTNGPTFNSANFGSIVFDGTNDYVTIPDSNSLDFGTGDFTCEAWVYVSGDGTLASGTLNERAFLCKKPNNTFNDSHFSLGYNVSDDTFKFLNGTTAFTTNSVSQGIWYHVAVSRQSGTIRLFLNGNLEDSGTKNSSITNTDSLLIGFRNGSNSAYFQGYISNLRIYKGKGLTAAEVQQNYNALKGRYV